MKKSLSVTDLCSYMFCPRSLYIKLVLGMREPAKPVMVLGSIRHRVFEDANSREKELVERISSGTPAGSVAEMFSEAYAGILDRSIQAYSPQLDALKMDKAEVAEKMQTAVKAQSEERAGQILEFASKNRVFGNRLWEKLSPKIKSEVRIHSKELKLRGIIDRIEMYGKEYVPVEIKTGRVPRTGVWPDHRIQVSAYGMLIKEKFGATVKEGMVRYVKEGQTRQVAFNPFMEYEVMKVRNSVFEMAEKEMPKFCGKSYCQLCSYGEDFERHLVRK